MPRRTKEHLLKTRFEKTEERYTVRGMLKDELYNLMHLERLRFFYTAFELTYKPAAAVKMVLQGYRRYLYPYLSYLLLVSTITIILSVRYKFFVTGSELTTDENPIDGLLGGFGFGGEFRKSFFYYAEDFATIVNIVAIPIFAVGSYLFFQRSKFNLAEHFILNVFIGAQQLVFLWVTIPFLELLPYGKPIVIGIYSVLVMIYNIWVYMTFFEGVWWNNLIRSLLSIGFGFTFQILFNYLVFFIIRPFLHYLDPIF